MTMTFLLAGKLPFELKSCLYFQDFIPQSYYNRDSLDVSYLENICEKVEYKLA